MFASDKVADNTAIVGIAVGVSVPCFAVVVIVIAVLIHRYKVKNRYRKSHEFHTDYVTLFQIATSWRRNIKVFYLDAGIC